MNTKLTNQELFHFCQQFSILLKAGISSFEGLELLMENSVQTQTLHILKELQASLEETGSLSSSMENIGCFPTSMTSYIRTGEETGCLDEVMESLAIHYEQECEIHAQLKSAVTYPLIMLGMMGAVIILLLSKVLPVFQQVFHQMGLEMNQISTGLLHIGMLFSQKGFLILLLCVFFIILAILLAFRFGKLSSTQIFALKLPAINQILIFLDLGRLSQGIHLGLRSGLAPIETLSLAMGMISHPTVREQSAAALAFLNDGELFEDALLKANLFTGLEGQLVRIGFHAGSAEEVMQKLSVKYQEEASEKIAQIIAIIEPTIVIILSILVGLVLLSVMLPLLGLLSEIAM